MDLQIINIQQSLNTPERITHDTLGKIYKAYKNQSFKVTKSTLRGAVSVDLAYDFWIDELTRKWGNFKITADALYQNWDDAAFREGIAKIYGDNYGVTESQLNKSLSFGCTETECKTGPFWHNTEVEVMDLRPFTNISRMNSYWNHFRIHGHNEDWDHSRMALKEAYVQIKSGSINVDFWGGMSSGEHLEKLWVEGNKNSSSPCLTWVSADGGNYGQTIIDHFYFRNNCVIPSGTITRNNGTTFGYINPQYGWQYRGWWAQNIIVDSPMPLQLNSELGWGNGLNNTTFWVPDHQLGDYIKMFNTIGDAVPNVYSFTDYNITFPRFAHWYEYPGIELYDDKDNYMYANGNDN